MPNTLLLPPSDFKDLLISLQEVEALTDDLFRHVCIPPNSATPRTYTRQQLLTRARTLQQEYADLDTHYGWVLASDRELLARMFEPANENGKLNASVWMKNVCERYEETKAELRATIDRLGRNIEG